MHRSGSKPSAKNDKKWSIKCRLKLLEDRVDIERFSNIWSFSSCTYGGGCNKESDREMNQSHSKKKF